MKSEQSKAEVKLVDSSTPAAAPYIDSHGVLRGLTYIPAGLSETEYLIQIARSRSTLKSRGVRAARIVITRIVDKLNARVILEAAEAQYVADALAAALGNPSRASLALGLIPRKGAPQKGNAHLMVAGLRVSRLVSKGMTLDTPRPTNGIDDDEGAYAQVAKDLNMSQANVKRGYRLYREMTERLLLSTE